MNRAIIFIILISSFMSSAFAGGSSDMSEKLKDSIVYLQISYYAYDQYQPWRNKELTESSGVGCAVGANKVITTAYNVANAAFISAKKAGRNEYISAKIEIIDYESNLTLIELDSNSLGKPLVPLVFSENYKKGAGVNFYWLSSGGQIYNGRGFLDRTSVDVSAISFSRMLTFIAAGTSDSTSFGHLYCLDNKPLGIACWSNENKESGIIPSKVINRFLADVKGGKYKGAGITGFDASSLLEPATRKYLKMPDNIQNGVYISAVHTIGTGSDVLKVGDVLLAIDGFDIDPYGKFKHPQFDVISFDFLITNKTAGDKITFEIWRGGRAQKINTLVKHFDVSQMLVPWYDNDRQPEYIIVGGCILQKLTKTYLAARGNDWQGKVEPHIYDYLLNHAFDPTEQRKQIVILSYVLPANINLGYHNLGQLVVDSINGMKINSIKDVPQALSLNPESKFHVIEFEMEQPAIVLDRKQLDSAGISIAQNYGIDKIYNINLINN